MRCGALSTSEFDRRMWKLVWAMSTLAFVSARIAAFP